MAKVAVMLADGFEEIEGLTVVDICRRCSIDVVTVSIMDSEVVVSSHKIPITADKKISEVNFEEIDMIVLPGGIPGTPNLESCEMLMEQLDAFYKNDKYLAAICAAPSIFGHRGYLKGRVACSYPSFESHLDGATISREACCIDGKIITGRGMGVSIPFALKIAETLVGIDTAKKVSEGIIYE